MAAFFDTYQLLTGKPGIAAAAMTCAAVTAPVNARNLSALAWGTAP